MRIDCETRIEQGELEHTPEAVEQFMAGLAVRFPGQRVAVALEQSRGALIYMLGKYEHLILYPIHPNALDHYRKSVYPSGAKSDPADAALILDLLYTHPERLRPFHPHTVETRTLQLLVEARREAVDDKTRYLNRLTAQLKMFFPQVLDWFSTVDTVVVGQLLQKWPTLDELQRSSVPKVAGILCTHHISNSRIAVLQQLIGQAVPAIRKLEAWKIRQQQLLTEQQKEEMKDARTETERSESGPSPDNREAGGTQTVEEEISRRGGPGTSRQAEVRDRRDGGGDQSQAKAARQIRASQKAV